MKQFWSNVHAPVKVNAWADEGIAPLVEVLNLFPAVETLDSCEGRDGKDAYVYFRCGGNSFEARPKETCDFVIWLSSVLRSHPNPCSDYRLRLEWTASEEPMAEIITQRDNIGSLVRKISLVATSQVSLRTNQFGDDTELVLAGQLLRPASGGLDGESTHLPSPRGCHSSGATFLARGIRS